MRPIDQEMAARATLKRQRVTVVQRRGTPYPLWPHGEMPGVVRGRGSEGET